ncbi:phosphatidylinositol-specific phospholipase C [Coniochaeta sp. 2T2.1]|nr:phosphatidylinositol-specific phospholipase C [Coniochaeta sp. 2T2.1]
MASLTIRNLTINPLTLLHVERFEADTAKPAGSPVANITSNVTTSIRSFLNPIHTPPAPGLVARSEDPHDRHNDVNVRTEPFTTNQTEIRAADPGREVLRLTFEEPGIPGRYTVDVPGSNPRSLTLNKLDGAQKEITAVYVPTGAFLTLLSSKHLSRWMEELDNETPVSCLSLPGTHNSPTCHVALPSVRCQAVGVREQLDNGVRFLDIRVSANPDNDELTLVHSAFPVSLTGNRRLDSDLLSDVYGFLDANPSETVLISLKREGTGKASDQQLSRYLHDSGRYLGGDNARRWFTDPRLPKLGEVRGKCVLVRRFGLDDGLRGEHEGRGWGIDGSAWPDNCEDAPTGSGLIRVQDFYEVTESTNIQKKIDMARAHLEKAAEQVFALPGREGVHAEALPPLFVNFLTASNFFNASCWPERIAAKINPAMVEYLCMRHGEHGKGPGNRSVGDACTGIVVTDWVGHNGDWDLIRCIVGWNARLQLKR